MNWPSSVMKPVVVFQLCNVISALSALWHYNKMGELLPFYWNIHNSSISLCAVIFVLYNVQYNILITSPPPSPIQLCKCHFARRKSNLIQLNSLCKIIDISCEDTHEQCYIFKFALRLSLPLSLRVYRSISSVILRIIFCLDMILALIQKNIRNDNLIPIIFYDRHTASTGIHRVHGYAV